MYQIRTFNNISDIIRETLTKDAYQISDSGENYDAVLVRSADLHETQFPKSLLAIARAGAGTNNVPVDECTEKGIAVFNTPGANANAVKEMVLAGMLLAARDIVGGINWVRENANDPDIAKVAEKKKKNFAGTELCGKTLGVIGLGAVGAKVANSALTLGLQVYGYDPFLSVESAWSLDRRVNHTRSLDTIYEQCDYISIHVPAIEGKNGTVGMIDTVAISKMKQGVVFLNFARDVLVNEEAMADALADGKVRKYVTDFANPLTTKMENAIVTPHLGASTEEAEENCAVMAVEELKNYLESGNINNSVNFPRVDLGPAENVGRIAIFHMNVPNMIGQISTTFSNCGINIDNMTDKSRGEYAYALIDAGSEIGEDVLEKLSAIEGVYRIRVIK